MTKLQHRQTGSSSIAASVIQKLIENRPLFEKFLRGRVQDDLIAQDLLQQSFVKAIQ